MEKLYDNLSHLKNEEIDSLISKYYNPDYRVKDIINEYNLNILPSKLLSFFPPLKHDDILCKFCQCSMFSKRLSKSEHQSRYQYEKDKFCLKCGHISSTRTFGVACKCDSCAEARALEKRLEEKKQIEALNNKKVKLNKFRSNLSLKPIPEENDILSRLYLSTLCVGYLDDNMKLFRYFVDDDSLAPTTALLKEMITRLFQHNYIIPSEHPYNLEHMEFLEEGTKVKYSPIDIKFELNVVIDENLNILDEMLDSECLDLVDKRTLLDIWKQIGYHELMQFLYYQVDQYQLNIDYIGDKIKDMVKILLDDFSVAESYSIIYSSVKGVAAYKQKENISNKHAVNTIYTYLYNQSNKIKIGEWQKFAYKRNFDLPQTIISKQFFDVCLGIGDKGFSLQPKIEHIPVGDLFINENISTFEPFPDNITTRGYEFVSYMKKYITEYYAGDDLDTLLNDIETIRNLYEKIQFEVSVNQSYEKLN